MTYRSLAHTIRELLISSLSGDNLYEVRRGPTPASTKEKQRKGAKKARASRSTKPLMYKTKKGRSVFISRTPIFETVASAQGAEKPIAKLKINRDGSSQMIVSTRAPRRRDVNLTPEPEILPGFARYQYVNPVTGDKS
jgi:hypothetical protein